MGICVLPPEAHIPTLVIKLVEHLRMRILLRQDLGPIWIQDLARHLRI